MAKVIVERPRLGSRMPTKGKGYDRSRQRVAWEDQPKRERMKLRGRGSKHLNEHLGPLRRYLQGKVGQRWDKIFADVCRYLDRGSAVQDHVRDHLEDYVATRVSVKDGQIFRADGVRWPLYSRYYVCPQTGILKENPNYRRSYRKPRRDQALRFLDNYTAIMRKNGEWLVVEFRAFPPPPKLDRRGKPATCKKLLDVIVNQAISRTEAKQMYGSPIYAHVVRRANKRETWRARNSYPYTNLVR